MNFRDYLISKNILRGSQYEDESLQDIIAGSIYFEEERNLKDPVYEKEKIWIDVFKSGVYLRINQQLKTQSNKKITKEEIKAVIEKYQIVDHAPIDQLVRLVKMSDRIKIAEWIPNKAKDANVNIRVSEDYLKVYANIMPPKEGGCYLKIEDIIYKLLDKKIQKEFVLEHKIDYLIHLQRRSKKESNYILIGEGVKPLAGKDAYWENVILKAAQENAEKNESSNKVIHNFFKIEKGEIVFQRVVSTAGVCGKNVYGEKIVPQSGVEKLDLLNILNLKLNETGMQYESEIDGHMIVYADQSIAIKKIIRLHDDIGPKTGNIKIDGSVEIHGSVENGYQVEATGNVLINGTVDNGYVVAGGDVIVDLGIQGRDINKAKVISRYGSVKAKFIQNSTVKAMKEVIFNEYIAHSYVFSKDKIISFNRRSSIWGGNIRALNRIEVGQLGSIANVLTIVEVGVEPALLEKQEKVEMLLEKTERIITQYKNKLLKLKIDTSEYFKLDQEVKEYQVLKEEIQSKIDRIKKKYSRIDYLSIGEIIAKVKLFPNVQLKCNAVNYQNQKDRDSVKVFVNIDNPQNLILEKINEDEIDI